MAMGGGDEAARELEMGGSHCGSGLYLDACDVANQLTDRSEVSERTMASSASGMRDIRAVERPREGLRTSEMIGVFGGQWRGHGIHVWWM